MDEVISALRKNPFDKDVLLRALLLKDNHQERLFCLAREKRETCFSEKFCEIRSVIEVSNVCHQDCYYCGINKSATLERYCMDSFSIMNIVDAIYAKGRRVLLFQSGENDSENYIKFVCGLVKQIKDQYRDLIIILCFGNLEYNHYKELYQAGADRYILKFETSNSELYKKIKPNDSLEERMQCIHSLEEIGFDIGTGNIIGLPSQTMEDIVEDLLLISKFKLTMMSTSLFIPGEGSIFSGERMGNIDVALNFMALLRILYPEKLMPATSSLNKAKPEGQLLGLLAGANAITIHDGTPEQLKTKFPIYSNERFTPKEDYVKDVIRKVNVKMHLD